MLVNQPLSDDIVEAINTSGFSDESFALLLSHEYTESSISNFGCGALKGVDRVRFGALEEANANVASDKKLSFLIVELEHFVLYAEHFNEAGWFEDSREQEITWYTTGGEDSVQVEGTKAVLNFLNPAGETLNHLWMPHGVKEFHGYTGNEGPTSTTKYSRYAIAAWPENRPENALKMMFPLDWAIEALLAHKCVDATTLRLYLDQVYNRFETEQDCSPEAFAVELCQLFSELLLESGDPALVTFFFLKLCRKLGGIRDNETLVLLIVAIIRKYDWRDIGYVLLLSLSKSYLSEWRLGYSEVELTLRVINDLDARDAQRALLKMVFEKVVKLKDEQFCSPMLVPLLWKWSRLYDDEGVFKALSNKLMEVDPSQLGSAIEGILQLLPNEETGELFELVKLITQKRVAWLEGQVADLGKPFTWEMPSAEFRNRPSVEKFLRGPEESMDAKDEFTFESIKAAQENAVTNTWMNQRGASCKVEPVASGNEVYLKITKTRKWFEDQQKLLEQYMAELSHLTERFGKKTDESTNKHALDEEVADGGDEKRVRHE